MATEIFSSSIILRHLLTYQPEIESKHLDDGEGRSTVRRLSHLERRGESLIMQSCPALQTQRHELADHFIRILSEVEVKSQDQDRDWTRKSPVGCD